jgi:hypothetical protein
MDAPGPAIRSAPTETESRSLKVCSDPDHFDDVMLSRVAPTRVTTGREILERLLNRGLAAGVGTG